jgi:hypothetical protein
MSRIMSTVPQPDPPPQQAFVGLASLFEGGIVHLGNPAVLGALRVVEGICSMVLQQSFVTVRGVRRVASQHRKLTNADAIRPLGGSPAGDSCSQPPLPPLWHVASHIVTWDDLRKGMEVVQPTHIAPSVADMHLQFPPSVPRVPLWATPPWHVLALHTHDDIHAALIRVDGCQELVLAFSGVRTRAKALQCALRVGCGHRPSMPARAHVLALWKAWGLKPSLSSLGRLKSLPPEARLALGTHTLALDHTAHNNAVRAALELSGRGVPLVVCGFSFGGAMAQCVGSALAIARHPERDGRTLIIALGSPRTGNAAWASWFHAPCEGAAHVHLALAGQGCVDPIITMPSTAMGFATCIPLVLVHPDGTLITDDGTVAATDAWNSTSRWMFCLRSIRFLQGFTEYHKLPLTQLELQASSCVIGAPPLPR